MSSSTETPLLDRIESVFGSRGFPDRLFYTVDNALRFELGGDRDFVDRFLEVMCRARAVAVELFAASTSLTVIRKSYSWDGAPRENRPNLKLLRDMGAPYRFSPPESARYRDDLLPVSDDAIEVWRALEIEADPRLIEAVLWSALSFWPVTRTPADNLYIVDFERGLALWPYDDRGMDVIATSRAPLVDIYRKFQPWLLDYDRARMDATFAT